MQSTMNGWGTVKMTRIKIAYIIQHLQLPCSLYLGGILLLGIGFLCTKSILYHGPIPCKFCRYIYAMMGDPSLGQHSGHAYTCTNAEGLFITDADKHLSHSLTFPFSHFPQISLILHRYKYTQYIIVSFFHTGTAYG